ncbi:MAG: MFS transporter [Candidatus Pacebacteria bacterium]|nr:MFS transporter [Candidatus Paceibacterota bacterium]
MIIPKKQKITSIFLIGFIFSFSLAIPTYINSTFLNNYVSEGFVGIFYILSSIFTLLLMMSAGKILQKFGNYKTMIYALLINIISLVSLVVWDNLFVVITALTTHLVIIALIAFNIDVFLESFSEDSSTGKIRGTYLSFNNLAWLISPMISGFILLNNEYWKVYLFSGILTIPILYLIIKNLKNFEDPKYVKTDILDTLKIIFKRPNVSKIFWAHFLLRFFYSWMIIYMPIYLHEYIGFDWSTIGIIFTMMLLPFVILEIPLGKLADEKIGEKEILNFGFLIAGITTAMLTFITSHSVILWGLLLFMTRVGASMIEIASESYFFKKIDGSDTNILNVFRMTGPSAYILGPLTASILLIFIEINYLFVILGAFVAIGGITREMTLKDTK